MAGNTELRVVQEDLLGQPLYGSIVEIVRTLS